MKAKSTGLPANHVVPRGNSAGPGAMLRLIREQRANTRAELIAATGLARSTVYQRLDALMAQELVVAIGESASTGGRRSTLLAFNASVGVVLAADLGATHCRVAVTDLAGTILAEDSYAITIADGAEVILPWLVDRFDELLGRVDRDRAAVRAVGVGLPGPVELATGRAINPPIMPGWHAFPVSEFLSEQLDAPALVDNDVNVMALGERWLHWPETEHLLFIKVGTGIGSGIIASGALYRGADGAAGDLGHIPIARAAGVVCRCGNTGCLEAVAGGTAIAAQLTETGTSAANALDVVAHVLAGNRNAIQLVRQAGRDIGDVAASVVSFFNPAVMIFGGELADASEQLLAGVREVVYQRSLPLATRHLTIVRSAGGDRAGVVGASVMAIEHILTPEAIDQVIASGAPL